MALRYWVTNGTTSTGLFSDTAHWSTSSGGAGGASVPGAADSAIFDANSSTTFYTVSLTANVTLTSIALDGLSATNRLLIQSSVLGTARTLNCVVASASYVDFRDIIGAGVGPWNLSAITGGSGQCGGNGGITFTTAKNLYWYQTVTGVAFISDATKWFNASGGTGGAGLCRCHKTRASSTHRPLPSVVVRLCKTFRASEVSIGQVLQTLRATTRTPHQEVSILKYSEALNSSPV